MNILVSIAFYGYTAIHYGLALSGLIFLLGTCILALGALIWSAATLVSGSVLAARTFRISPAVVGLTVIAFGTSAPELVVSAQAAIQGHGGLVVGNILGSNIANASLGLGIGLLLIQSSLTGNARLGWSLLAITLLAAGALIDSHLSRPEAGLLLFALLPAGWLIYRQMTAAATTATEATGATDPAPPQDGKTRLRLLLIPVSLAVLLISSEILIAAAADIAEQLGINQQLIGLTLLALGTSLPEVAAIVAAAYQRQTALILSNLIGSNFFNLITVMGIAGLILPLDTEPGTVLRDLTPMVLTSLVLVAVAIRPLPLRAGRWLGATLLGGYLAYLLVLSQQTNLW